MAWYAQVNFRLFNYKLYMEVRASLSRSACNTVQTAPVALLKAMLATQSGRATCHWSGSLASPGADAVGSEEAKRTEILKKVKRSTTVRCGIPDFAFHRAGFDLNGAQGSSAVHVLDCTVAFGAQFTTEPQAPIKRRSLQKISRTIA
jgi:hypothetical protein